MIELAERKGRGRKISIVHIAQILLSESDAEHPLSQQQILAFLRERYGMEMDRKAVRRNLEALRGGGLPVVCREVERVIEGKPAPLSLDWYWDHDLTKEDMKALIHLLYFSHPFSFTAIQKNSFLFYCTGGTLVHCKLPGAVSPRPFQHPAWNKHAARILHQIKGGFYYLH